ncbi:MAG: polyprenol monophosphomannose synthase [Acidimicrobiales bacterium]
MTRVDPVPVLVVLPTYQEAANIVEVLRRLREAVPAADVLVVDDSSPDGTADLAKAEAAQLGQIDVLIRPAKQGLGSAYRAGFSEGLSRGYSVLVEMDSDLSHDPAALPQLLAALKNADLVIGSRYIAGGNIPNWPLHRRLLSAWGNRYTGAALRLGVSDATSGFRAYRAETLAAVDLKSVRADGYGFQIEMVYRAVRGGLRVVESPISFTDRTRGRSKMSSRIVVEAMSLVTWWGLRDRARPARGRTPAGGGTGASARPRRPPDTKAEFPE